MGLIKIQRNHIFSFNGNWTPHTLFLRIPTFFFLRPYIHCSGNAPVKDHLVDIGFFYDLRSGKYVLVTTIDFDG